MSIKDQIRDEIERLRDEYTDIAIDSHYGTVNANHVVADFERLLSLLDSTPKQPVEGLEEAAEEYNKQVIEETKCHHNALTYAEGYEDALLLIPDAFKAGAEWQKAKMLEEAVEGKVFMSFAPGHNQMVMADVDLPTNTKVKVIIVKEDEK